MDRENVAPSCSLDYEDRKWEADRLHEEQVYKLSEHVRLNTLYRLEDRIDPPEDWMFQLNDIYASP